MAVARQRPDKVLQVVRPGCESGDGGAARKLEEVKAQLETLEREAAEQKLAAWRAKGGRPD